jgi:hypothetical protein
VSILIAQSYRTVPVIFLIQSRQPSKMKVIYLALFALQMGFTPDILFIVGLTMLGRLRPLTKRKRRTNFPGSYGHCLIYFQCSNPAIESAAFFYHCNLHKESSSMPTSPSSLSLFLLDLSDLSSTRTLFYSNISAYRDQEWKKLRSLNISSAPYLCRS